MEHLEMIAERAGMTMEQARAAARWISEAAGGDPIETPAALRGTIDNLDGEKLEPCGRLLLAILETIKGVGGNA